MKLLVKKYFNFAGQFSSKISSGFSNREHGNMSVFYGDTKKTLLNRNNFLDSLGIKPKNLVSVEQVHGSNIKCITKEDKVNGVFIHLDSIPKTDGLLTDIKRLALAIFTADCPSIFLYDPLSSAVGLIHAGWRSTKEGIGVKAIKLMQMKFKTKPEELFVGFGPCIRSCCYEVSRDFGNYFPDELIERNGKFYLDLVRVNSNQLFSLGVRKENIFDAESCTSCERNDFFSYRVEGKDCGRQMSVVMLK
ncbi:MAG: peptidoglycan editing factor PgeF [Candidatus Omnitrophica bacterium]|nr:peptidoglycan editing factor PgeF [Candidatus Omnitrophota bacterium]